MLFVHGIVICDENREQLVQVWRCPLEKRGVKRKYMTEYMKVNCRSTIGSDLKMKMFSQADGLVEKYYLGGYVIEG